jgi:hypothetical protein
VHRGWFAQSRRRLERQALAITAAALLVIFRLRWSVVLRTLGICAALGLAAAGATALW